MFRRVRVGTGAAAAGIGACGAAVLAAGISVLILAGHGHARATGTGMTRPARPPRALSLSPAPGTARADTGTPVTGTRSVLRLQQLLAQLGYLPVTCHKGTFTWQSGYPATLDGFWQPGRPNLITTGAIMAFQSQHGMRPDGTASPSVWAALLRAASQGQKNTAGYTYAIATKTTPETLTIWHDGRKVLRSYANTGIPLTPTATGTFPVYLRYYFQIMRGTNPDGSRYADPVYYVSYFHGGEAVHYFSRGAYGWPQSLGCVELPWSAAAKAWPYLTYGSLVTIGPR